MSLFRKKKKKAQKKNNSKIQTTIDNSHTKKLEEFENNKKQIPIIQKEIENLNNLLKKFNLKPTMELSEENINKKIELIDKIKNLNQKLNKLKCNKMKNNYIMNTSHLLFDYYDNTKIEEFKNINKNKKTVLDFFGTQKIKIPEKKNNSLEISDKKGIKKTKNKSKIMDEYFTYIDKRYVKKMNNISVEELDKCKICDERRIFDSVQSILICPICGCEEKILIDSDTPSYKEPPREITYFAYKKINHANEWLSQFQAKESTDISDDIFEKIQNELKKESYLNLKNLSANKVRDILKKLDLTKYYEHCHYITNRITGKPAPVITGELEDKLRNMFKEIQGPWMKYCPSERSNFFSYPYIFYKFFQLLDKDDYLPYCRLLKSREKLQEHDQVWKRICRDLKWQYIPTV
tara:strand:+ start:253 stop:1470 length:1218 start_codon:yes stop_codon:yes gene_type:complete